MRANTAGVSISVAVHLCILTLFICLSPVVKSTATKIITVDFTLMGSKAGPARGLPDTKGDAKKPQIKAEAPKPKPASTKPETAAAIKDQSIQPVSPQTVTASDPNGQTIVHGIAANGSGSSGTDSGSNGTGEGTGKTGQHGGPVGSSGGTIAPGSRDYEYIRETVMKNISYPVRARRMGYEGTVVISFIVLENGSTSEIKVVKGSGRKLLDENALEGIAKTVIARKVPYRAYVRIPIIYKLDGSQDDMMVKNITGGD